MQRDPSVLLARTLGEFGTALEKVRAAQGHLVEQRTRMEELRVECEDRAAFMAASAHIAADREPFEVSLKVRPRERAPLVVHASVTSDGIALRWILRLTGPVAAHVGQL
jgi:hypothetical protein